MKLDKTLLLVTGFLTLSASGLIYVFMIPPPVPERPPGVFEKAGYQVLVPHVDTQPPGYFDTVEQRTKSEVSLHRTCNIPFAEIEPFIVRTRTVDERITQKLRAGYEADASVLAMDGSVSLEGVRHVQVRYENSAIWYLTTESLYSIRNKYLQGACEEAIQRDLEKGLSVCQTKKVIVSDIVFEVTYESGTQTTVEAPLSVTLSGAGEGSHNIHGKKMFHAVKLDEACFSLNPNLDAT